MSNCRCEGSLITTKETCEVNRQSLKEYWRFHTMDDERSMLSRRYVWNETRSREEAKIHRKRKGFATVQLSTTEFLEKRDTDRKTSFRKGKPDNMLRLDKRMIVQNGMSVITGILLSLPFIKQGIANLGISVRSSTRKRLGANRRNENILWWSPKHRITPKQR